MISRLTAGAAQPVHVDQTYAVDQTYEPVVNLDEASIRRGSSRSHSDAPSVPLRARRSVTPDFERSYFAGSLDNRLGDGFTEAQHRA